VARGSNNRRPPGRAIRPTASDAVELRRGLAGGIVSTKRTSRRRMQRAASIRAVEREAWGLRETEPCRNREAGKTSTWSRRPVMKRGRNPSRPPHPPTPQRPHIGPTMGRVARRATCTTSIPRAPCDPDSRRTKTSRGRAHREHRRTRLRCLFESRPQISRRTTRNRSSTCEPASYKQTRGPTS